MYYQSNERRSFDNAYGIPGPGVTIGERRASNSVVQHQLAGMRATSGYQAPPISVIPSPQNHFPAGILVPAFHQEYSPMIALVHSPGRRAQHNPNRSANIIRTISAFNMNVVPHVPRVQHIQYG